MMLTSKFKKKISSKIVAKPQSSAIEKVSGAYEAILLQAAFLFSTKGYAESGLREIADRAGIRSSTVYYHFKSKEKIYETIIEKAMLCIFQSVTQEINALPKNASIRRRIDAAIKGHLLALHSNKPFTSTNAHSRITLPPKVDRAIRAMRNEYSDFWQALIVEAQNEGALKTEIDPQLLRPILLGTLNRTVSWFDDQKSTVDSLITSLIVMFSGIWKTRSSRI